MLRPSPYIMANPHVAGSRTGTQIPLLLSEAFQNTFTDLFEANRRSAPLSVEIRRPAV
jgi:hypothetical protein